MIDPNNLQYVEAKTIKEGDVILVTGDKVHRWKKVTHVRTTSCGVEVSTSEFTSYPSDHIFVVRNTETYGPVPEETKPHENLPPLPSRPDVP